MMLAKIKFNHHKIVPQFLIIDNFTLVFFIIKTMLPTKLKPLLLKYIKHMRTSLIILFELLFKLDVYAHAHA